MNGATTHLYTALLDVLAYRAHLEEDRRSGSLAFQEKLAVALKVFDSINEAIFRVRAISDTIILTCSTHKDFPRFLCLLRDVFLAFLGQRLFVRGGVAYSRHFESNHLTYSHAVATAYEIESALALYPRIVIDRNIVRMYEIGSGLPDIRNSGLICVENDVYFLNVITSENWKKVWSYAREIYSESVLMNRSSQNVFIKHVLFERYLLTSPHAPVDSTAYIPRIVEM